MNLAYPRRFPSSKSRSIVGIAQRRTFGRGLKGRPASAFSLSQARAPVYESGGQEFESLRHEINDLELFAISNKACVRSVSAIALEVGSRFVP